VSNGNGLVKAILNVVVDDAILLRKAVPWPPSSNNNSSLVSAAFLGWGVHQAAFDDLLWHSLSSKASSAASDYNDLCPIIFWMLLAITLARALVVALWNMFKWKAGTDERCVAAAFLSVSWSKWISAPLRCNLP